MTFFKTSKRIAARNASALEFVKPHGIPVDALNPLMTGHPEYYSGNMHFNEQGFSMQADQVASQSEKLSSADKGTATPAAPH